MTYYRHPNLGGWIADFFGKPQSWYNRVDAAQKALAVRAAEVNALGSDAWTAVRDAFFQESQGPDLDFLSFSDVNNGITSSLKSIIVTKSHVPSDLDIQNAESWNATYGRYVDYVKGMIPELAQRVADAAANVRKMLSAGSMRSPEEVGEQAFEDEMARRAKLLGAGLGMGVALYLAIPVLLASAFSGRSKR